MNIEKLSEVAVRIALKIDRNFAVAVDMKVTAKLVDASETPACYETQPRYFVFVRDAFGHSVISCVADTLEEVEREALGQWEGGLVVRQEQLDNLRATAARLGVKVVEP